MESDTVLEPIEQDQSRKMYEDSLEVMDELYRDGFDGVDFTQEDAYMLQRLQHNITSNTFWRVTLGDDFPEEVFFRRLRLASQALFLLGRRNALREKKTDEN